MSALRVMLVGYRDDPGLGGSWRVGRSLGAGLHDLGVDVELCYAYGAPAGAVWQNGMLRHYLGLRSSREIARWPRFRRLLRRRRPQIVHFVDPSVWMYLASRAMSLRTVVHVHGPVSDTRPIGHVSPASRLIWRVLPVGTDLFVCITEGSRRSLLARGIAPCGQTTVVYNGVDFDWLQHRPPRAAARAQLGVTEEGRLAGMVGRLSAGRGCDDLLRMIQMLGPEWHALLVGDGPERPNLERLAQELGVRERVWFTGNLLDVRVAYSAMDAFLFLPHYETFGLAVAEAMACRVPVFGLGGLGDYREPENPLVTQHNAVFVERSDPRRPHVPDLPALRELAARVAAYGRNPTSVAPMLEQAWRHVRAQFTVTAQAERLLRVYEQLLRGRPIGSPELAGG